MNERVLLVEDDAGLRDALALVLRATGMQVEEVGDGRDAVERFDERGADVVVLDVMLPGLDGFEVCRELRRRSRVPIVMVTARDAASDIVRGLELGADDYVVKPFESAVLLARLRAVLRRSAPGDDDETAVEAGSIKVDTGAWRAWRDGDELELTATELRLLAELVRHTGQVLTREVLLERVWGYDYLGDSRLVDMAIKRLRDKVEDEPSHPVRITTVRGVGYRFE
ncbi:MAG TPA: response regulator transcription factor [Acidimicrobiales bacterium]|nr:response regulator transcription factor [Acidimicrobiales bacterium]